MKKLLLFFVLMAIPAQSAQIVNVEYIHNAIKQKWDITVPYNAELTNPMVAANMKYLLTAVDVANEMLNGEATTDYGNGEFATTQAADTIATDTAVETLVKKPEKYKFSATVTTTVNDIYAFGFSLGAAGTFYVDWGDGTEEVIEKTDTASTTYSHTYANSGLYTFRLGGLATGYNDVISFSILNPDFNLVAYIKNISGCLGCIFPTLSDGSQPWFGSTFAHQSYATGEIPARLFSGIHGTPRNNMFAATFLNTGFTSIGAPLFDDLSGGMAYNMFSLTFSSSRQLTGPSAQMKMSDGTLKYLYEVYPNATASQVEGCYWGATGLSDYANMPSDWTYWDI